MVLHDAVKLTQLSETCSSPVIKEVLPKVSMDTNATSDIVGPTNDTTRSITPQHVKNTSSESSIEVMERIADICINDEAEPSNIIYEGQNTEKMKRLEEAKQKFPDLFVLGVIEEEDEKDQCSICLELYTCDNPAIDCDCGHQFHLQCVEEWMQRSSNCPVCWQKLRHPLMEETPPTRAVSFSHRSHRSHHHSTTHHHVSNSTPIGSQRRHQSMSNVTTPTSQGILGRLFSKLAHTFDRRSNPNSNR